jgi:hypothetical protein
MEGPALQGAAQDYQVARAPGADCFHPKVWIIIGGEETVLLVGSGNLTQAGFVNNAELFDALRINAENPTSPQLLESLQAFVRGLAQMWPMEDSKHLLCTETLGRIGEALSMLPRCTAQQDEIRFLNSFRGSLLDQLPEIPNSRELYIASPYFGGSLEGVNLLARKYSTAKLKVFPGVHEGKATDIPLSELSARYKEAQVAPLSIPLKEKSQFAHLKLYGVTTSEEKAWLYCTSANCTKAAWSGPNVKAGLLRLVPRSSLYPYFIPDDSELPPENITYAQTGHAQDVLEVWAADYGMRLEVVVAEDCADYLPLTRVRMTIRAGSNLSVCERTMLFNEGRTADIDWSVFPDWHRRKKMTVCLEIEAKTAVGHSVRGRCFVENRLLLSADPIQRSAWRGALALLEEEGAPELADIAALFSLARDVFNGTLARMPKSQLAAKGNAATKKQEEESVPVAVWPPRPDLRELQRNIGSTAVGRLQWFQRIFQSFINHDEKTENDSVQIQDVDATDNKNGQNAETGKRREQEVKRTLTVAQRIWANAIKDYDQLCERLVNLCPEETNAHNVWPAGVFAFLCTLAIFRTVKRLAPGVDLKTNGTFLCDDFSRLMLNEREQKPDFCCTRTLRYRTEKFPALADDLRKEFKLYPHAALTMVLLALFTDQLMRSPMLAALFVEKRLQQICEPGFQLDAETIVSCQRIWTRYVWDGGTKTSETEFVSTLQKLPFPQVPSTSS